MENGTFQNEMVTFVNDYENLLKSWNSEGNISMTFWSAMKKNYQG